MARLHGTPRSCRRTTLHHYRISPHSFTGLACFPMCSGPQCSSCLILPNGKTCGDPPGLAQRLFFWWAREARSPDPLTLVPCAKGGVDPRQRDKSRVSQRPDPRSSVGSVNEACRRGSWSSSCRELIARSTNDRSFPPAPARVRSTRSESCRGALRSKTARSSVAFVQPGQPGSQCVCGPLWDESAFHPKSRMPFADVRRGTTRCSLSDRTECRRRSRCVSGQRAMPHCSGFRSRHSCQAKRRRT